MSGVNRRKRNGQEPSRDLNLIPVLNLVLMLIPAILISAVFVEVAVINVSAPALPSQSSSVDAGPADPLQLTIELTEKGFNLASDTPLPKPASRTAFHAGPTIPRLSDGRYDFEALREALAVIKDAHPEEERVIIRAEPDIPYEHVVETLDTARETPDRRLLFPDAILSPGLS